MQNNPADFSLLAYAQSKPELIAQLKKEPEDFVVEEVSSNQLSGTGEHLWCWVEKRQQNTDWVAGQLAKWAQTSKKNIGFAGQKDRHSVSRQWFSIHLPGKPDPDLNELDVEGVIILSQARHNRKLQRGDLVGNQFLISLKNIQAKATNANNAEIKELQFTLEKRLQTIQQQGFPNYFGSQRFGWQGNNLQEAQKLFAIPADKAAQKRNKRNRNQSQRNKQGLYVSAVRSWMFNELLSLRIQENTWNQSIHGDLILLDDKPQAITNDEMLSDNKFNALGTLFGDAALCTEGHAKALEERIQNQHPIWMKGLQDRRVQPAYRSFAIIPQNFSWQWLEKSASQGDAGVQFLPSLQLSFQLPAGCFATALLRECVDTFEEKRVL